MVDAADFLSYINDKKQYAVLIWDVQPPEENISLSSLEILTDQIKIRPKFKSYEEQAF